MRRSARAAKRKDNLLLIITSLLAGAGALAVTALIMSFFAVTFDLPESSFSALSGIALAAGCFACAYNAAGRRREGGLVTGFVCGIAVFAAVMVIGLLTVRVFSAGGFITKLIIVLTASAIGGIKGVNSYPFNK